MSVETDNGGPAMGVLLQEWSRLSVGDRKGILQRLPVEQRLFLQRLSAPQGTAAGSPAKEASQDRRYSAYSKWLADLMQACEDDTPFAAHIKPLARRALLDAHGSTAGVLDTSSNRPSLSELVRSLLQSWRKSL